MGWRDRAEPVGGGGGSWRERAQPVDDVEIDLERNPNALDVMSIEGDAAGYTEPERAYGDDVSAGGRLRAMAEQHPLTSFVTGLGQGASMGTVDELAGGALGATDYERAPVRSALQDRAVGFLTQSGPVAAAVNMGRDVAQYLGAGSYEDERDAARQAIATTREANPVSYFAGNVAGGAMQGGAAAPVVSGARTGLGRVAASGGIGAAEGMLRGAGETEATPGTQRFADDTLTGGAIGAATGGLVQGGGEVARRASAALRGAAPRLDRFAATRRAREMGVTGAADFRDIERAGGAESFVRDARRLGVSGGGEGAEEALDRAASNMEAVSARMDDAAGVGGFRDAPAARVDVRPIVARLEQEAQRAERLPGGRQIAQAARELIDEYSPHVDGGMTFRDAHSARRLMDNAGALWQAERPRLPQQLEREVRGMLSSQMESAAEGVDPALRQQWRDANRTYGLAKILSRASGRDEARAAARQGGLGLVDAVVGGPAAATMLAATGDLMSTGGAATAAVLAGRVVRSPRVQARTAETLAAIARRAPERLGRFATPIANALARGPQAYAASFYVLSQQDPEFRELVDGLESEETP